MCGHEDALTSFLIPVKTKFGALYLSDDIIATNNLAFGLGLRYDKIKHKPHYTPGVTPKIADDMVSRLIIPPPSHPSDEEKRQNAIENIKQISKPKEYKKSSYAFSMTYDPFSFMRVQTKYSSGFRAPTSDEIYFTFHHPDFTILPNNDLKAEIAKTKELAFTFHHQTSFLSIDFFQTNYSNFIDLTRDGFKEQQVGSETRKFIKYKNVNYSKAKANGIELNAKADLSLVHENLAGFSIGYKLTKQKGKIFLDKYNMWAPMNAIQPRTDIISLGYLSPNEKFGADLHITKVKAKKSSDTYNIYWEDEGKSKNDHNLKWMSTGYTTLDMIAFYKPIENLTFKLGIYNITDKKYLTWENARSIRPFGTSKMIDQDSGKGINRFYSPGRNFKLNFEMKF